MWSRLSLLALATSAVIAGLAGDFGPFDGDPVGAALSRGFGHPHLAFLDPIHFAIEGELRRRGISLDAAAKLR